MKTTRVIGNLANVNIKEATKKLNRSKDSSLLNNDEMLFFIDECEFNVYLFERNNKKMFILEDRTGANLGDIESELYSSLGEIIDRLYDTYLIDNGFVDDNSVMINDFFYIANYNTEKNIEIFESFNEAKEESINKEVYRAKLNHKNVWHENGLGWIYEDKSSLFITTPEKVVF